MQLPIRGITKSLVTLTMDAGDLTFVTKTSPAEVVQAKARHGVAAGAAVHTPATAAARPLLLLLPPPPLLLPPCVLLLLRRRA